MNLSSHFGELNWLAVTLAAVAAFLLGAVWYAKPIFGAKWMREIGLTEEAAAKSNMKMIFSSAFVLMFVSATALAMFLGSPTNWLLGLHAGATIGIFWVATAFGVTYLFEQRSMRLFFINAGFYVVLYSLMGMIIGALADV